MNIGMTKIVENDNFVWYRFNTNVYEFKDGQPILVTKYGYCAFNKVTEEFELDKVKTDPYFLPYEKREVIKVYVKCQAPIFSTT